MEKILKFNKRRAGKKNQKSIDVEATFIPDYRVEYCPALKSATELAAPFLALNSVLSKQNVLFFAKINKVFANIPGDTVDFIEKSITEFGKAV